MQLASSNPAKVRVPTTQEIDDGWALPSELELGRKPLAVTGAPSPVAAVVSDGADGWPLAVDDTRINLNTADVDTLCALPGIGVRKARAIIAYRERCGRLESIVELDTLHGFGPLLIGRLSDLCRV